MNLRTRSGEKLPFDNWIFVLTFCSSSPTALANTNENCLFNTLALSVFPTANSPEGFSRGATQFLYIRADG